MTILKEFKFESAKPARHSPVRHSKQHVWVTVINPTNHRLLLQACDDCGVVKSENSVIRRCNASSGLAVISSSRQSQLAFAI